MLFKYISAEIDIDDSEMDKIYPEQFKEIAYIHFSPVEVCIRAARFLAAKTGTKVLDIGSGVGKFCMIGAVCTKSHFTGVEYRKSLHDVSIQLVEDYGLRNIEFKFANIDTIEFQDYNAFYFYNSFYENIPPFEPVTDEVELHNDLYSKYSSYVFNQLSSMPIGTKLATYHCSESIAPPSYSLVNSEFDDKLKFWKKLI